MSSGPPVQELFQLSLEDYERVNFDFEREILFKHLSEWIQQDSQNEDFHSFDFGLLGGGTGQIAIDIAKQWYDCQVMSCDESIDYLEQARFEIEVEGVTEQVQLHHLPKEEFGVAADQFHGVSSFYYLPAKKDLSSTMSSVLSTLKAGGRCCFIDFCRPEDVEEDQILRNSDFMELANRLNKSGQIEESSMTNWITSRLMASPTFSEVKKIVVQLGANPDNVTPVNSLQWIWVESSVS